jgi:hypothetical protein
MLHRNQAHAPYFGTELHERALVPAANARLAETRFEHWMNPVRDRHQLGDSG